MACGDEMRLAFLRREDSQVLCDNGNRFGAELGAIRNRDVVARVASTLMDVDVGRVRECVVPSAGVRDPDEQRKNPHA